MRTRARRFRASAGRRLVSPGGGAFTPASLGAALWAWFDPMTGTFQERTGASATTPAVADTDVVGTWRARAGTGAANAVASADANRPTIQTAELNNLPMIQFDGTNDALLFSAGTAVAFSQLQAAIVLKQMTATGAEQFIWECRNSGDADPIAAMFLVAADTKLTGRVRDDGSVALAAPVSASLATTVYELEYDGVAASMWQNGTEGTPVLQAGVATLNRLSFGNLVTPSLPAACFIGDFIIYSGARNPAVFAYLDAKWGL